MKPELRTERVERGIRARIVARRTGPAVIFAGTPRLVAALFSLTHLTTPTGAALAGLGVLLALILLFSPHLRASTPVLWAVPVLSLALPVVASAHQAVGLDDAVFLEVRAGEVAVHDAFGEALFAGPLDGVRLLTSGQDLVFEHGPARLRVRTAHSITQLLALREVWDAERARFGTEDDVPDAMRGVTRSRTEA